MAISEYALDEADLRILRALQDDPQLTMSALAERVGLSHTPCWRRLRKLEANGTITGRMLALNRHHLGFGVTVIAEITIKAQDEQVLTDFEAAVQAHPQIVECYSMSGAADYIIHVIVRSIPEYETLLKRVLLHLPGVGSINSRFALNRVKFTTNIPL
jgi:Lrp/AsnC family transcriptional regulator